MPKSLTFAALKRKILLHLYIIDVVPALSYYADDIFTTGSMRAIDPTWPSYESFVNEAEFIFS